MKKFTLSILCLFFFSFAVAQNAEGNLEKEKNLEPKVELDTQKENANFNNIIVPKNIDGTIVDAEEVEETGFNTAKLAVSNARNLKMLYVASSLFYTNNYALT